VLSLPSVYYALISLFKKKRKKTSKYIVLCWKRKEIRLALQKYKTLWLWLCLHTSSWLSCYDFHIQLLLGYLPSSHELWETQLKENRLKYVNMKKELLLNPVIYYCFAQFSHELSYLYWTYVWTCCSSSFSVFTDHIVGSKTDRAHLEGTKAFKFD